MASLNEFKLASGDERSVLSPILVTGQPSRPLVQVSAPADLPGGYELPVTFQGATSMIVVVRKSFETRSIKVSAMRAD